MAERPECVAGVFLQRIQLSLHYRDLSPGPHVQCRAEVFCAATLVQYLIWQGVRIN